MPSWMSQFRGSSGEPSVQITPEEELRIQSTAPVEVSPGFLVRECHLCTDAQARSCATRGTEPMTTGTPATNHGGSASGQQVNSPSSQVCPLQAASGELLDPCGCFPMSGNACGRQFPAAIAERRPVAHCTCSFRATGSRGVLRHRDSCSPAAGLQDLSAPHGQRSLPHR